MQEGISNHRSRQLVSFSNFPKASPSHPQVDTLKACKERRKTEDMGSFLSNEEAQPLMLTDCLYYSLPSPSQHPRPQGPSLSLMSSIRLSVDNLAGYWLGSSSPSSAWMGRSFQRGGHCIWGSHWKLLSWNLNFSNPLGYYDTNLKNEYLFARCFTCIASLNHHNSSMKRISIFILILLMRKRRY